MTNRDHENMHPEPEPEGHDFIYWPGWPTIAAIVAASYLTAAEAMGWVDLNIWNFGEW